MGNSNSSPQFVDATVVDIVHPSLQLCSSCSSFPWPSGLDTDSFLVEFLNLNKTFSSVQASAEEGCVLCRFIWSLMINDFIVTKELLESEEFAEGSIELHITKIEGVFTFDPQVRHNGRVIFGSTGTRFEHVECSELEAMGKLKTRHIKDFTEENIQHQLADLIEHQIRPWMESCCARFTDHENCGPEHNASGLPTRLVDVGKGNDSPIKLVDVKSSNHIQGFAYLILSYCWGSGNESSKTTENNLNARLRGFSVSELPKTIRDAILLT
ncbi:hypothetical protein FVEG_17467 [Fusarium verticillioides 7600]|uniref:Heterokaryon incompatibility domain-containing protein n=1 Tax=Gibberella moniliformis (strain M3125 / FGSC 7600) TaxID=334819 RepID=W7NFX4_GIBM7|nr:hypothetical protein FVEG_17467 [Fusarium verticillioides 7600]EWG55177.1 hypothetical protein FVEG_17467 [Fusarium verticillioides 7600]